MSGADFMYSMDPETRYELYYLMPGDRLSPPQTRGEWWKKFFFQHSRSWTPSLVEARDEAAEIQHVNGFKTKIVEVTITRKDI